MEFETYETSAGNHRWRLKADNHQEVANGGENFDSAASAKRAAESFKQHAATATFEVYPSGGQHRWRAKSSNGQTTASSGEPFASESNARRAANNVRDHAGSADGP